MSVPNRCLSQTDVCPKQMSVPNKYLCSIQLYIEEARKSVCPKQSLAPEGRAGGRRRRPICESILILVVVQEIHNLKFEICVIYAIFFLLLEPQISDSKTRI